MKRTTWLMFLIIMGVGTALRVVNLAEIPPGLFHDEACYGLDALTVARGGGFPIFFEGNGGREPFFIYLQALGLILFGLDPFVLRLTAAFIGIVTIPVFFVLVRALTAESKHSAALALLATAGLAVSYWHLHFSRVGFRAIALPLLICLTFYFFWRARRTKRLREHILTGVFLGMSLYTYLAARLLPIIFAFFWFIELLGILRSSARAPMFYRWVRGVSYISATALLVAAPLLVYFLNHPYAFFLRIGDVLVIEASALLSNLQGVAAMFYQHGDTEWRHNLAGRPLLDWAIGLPFAIGLVTTFLRWRKPESRLVLFWFAIMLLPTLLSQEAPDILRAIGAAPVLYVLIAWGFEAITTVTERVRWSRHKILPAATILVLVGSGVVTWRDYFVVWANHRRAFYDFQGDRVALARWINNQSGNLVIPLELYAEPTMLFLLQSRFSVVRSTFDLNEEERNRLAHEPTRALLPFHSGALVLLRENQAIFLNPHSEIEEILGQPVQSRWQDRWGRTVVTITDMSSQRLDERLAPPSFIPVKAYFDQRLELVGYTLDDRRIVPGKPYPITLYWARHQSLLQENKILVHLIDSTGAMVAGVTEYLAGGYVVDLLPYGQVIPDLHILKIDSDLPPGKYSIEVGVYRSANDSRLPVQINNSSAMNERILITPLKVAPS